jgi:PBP1b-binding outer membrane lipoprotein LpoB
MEKSLSRVLLFAITIFFLNSCNGNKTKLIARSWKIKDLKYTEAVPPEMQSTVDNWVHMMEDSFTLTYKPNGTYISRLGKNNLQGKWNLNLTGSAIVSTAPDGNKTDFKIIELTPQNFNFEANQNGSKVIFEMVPE